MMMLWGKMKSSSEYSEYLLHIAVFEKQDQKSTRCDISNVFQDFQVFPDFIEFPDFKVLSDLSVFPDFPDF